MSGGYLSGGNCPGGNCPGGNCPDIPKFFVLGVFQIPKPHACQTNMLLPRYGQQTKNFVDWLHIMFISYCVNTTEYWLRAIFKENELASQ